MNRRPMIQLSLAVLAVMLVASAWAWLQLPADARVPIHWGPTGEPDAYADKTIGLFLLPAITAGVVALLAVIPRVEPRRADLERSAKPYGVTWIGVVLLMGVIHLGVIAFALGQPLDITRFTLGATGLLFVAIGNYLPKVRPNFLMGIRTPWTLSSDLAWTRTHRVGGRLFVVAGLVMLALGLLDAAPEVLLAVLLGQVVVLLVVVVAYSYRVWKTDPERRVA